MISQFGQSHLDLLDDPDDGPRYYWPWLELAATFLGPAAPSGHPQAFGWQWGPQFADPVAFDSPPLPSFAALSLQSVPACKKKKGTTWKSGYDMLLTCLTLPISFQQRITDA